MSTIGNRLTVDRYDLMVANGILPEVTYLELVEGRIVEKCHMSPPSACAAEQCAEVLRSIVPKGSVRSPGRSGPHPHQRQRARTRGVRGPRTPRRIPGETSRPRGCRHGRRGYAVGRPRPRPQSRPGLDLRRRRHPGLLDYEHQGPPA